ncbi:hypothetical protein Esti_000739 [Eimeria stiedai]
MFYESRVPSESNKKRLSLHLQKYIHWTGKSMKLMAKKVERAWEYGAFQKYFDEKYPRLTDARGRFTKIFQASAGRVDEQNGLVFLFFPPFECVQEFTQDEVNN